MGEDLIIFGAGIGMVGFAFIPILLILYAVKWNERKNLFLDSWFVYLGLIISGIIGYLTYEYATRSFPINGKTIFASPFIPIIIFQTCLLTAILYTRCRPKKEFSLQFRKKERGQRPSLWKACETAFLVSSLTSLMIWGLITALEAMHDKPNSPHGLYD